MIEACFVRMAAGEVENKPRYRLGLDGGMLAVMGASDHGIKYAGAKVYAGFRSGARFEVVLFRTDAPELVAVIDADKLGQLRTGAASGVAARHLARVGCSESRCDRLRLAGRVAGRVHPCCAAGDRAGRRLLSNRVVIARVLRAQRRRAGSDRAGSSGVRRRRDGDRLVEPGSARRLAPSGRARLRCRRERRPAARARRRRARTRDVRLLRLGGGCEARVGRPDRADRQRRARLARGVRAAGRRCRRPSACRESDDDIVVFKSNGLAAWDVAAAAAVVARARERGVGREL